MAELKTRPTDADVGAFLEAIPDPGRRADAMVVCALLADLTGEPPVLWGDSIVGFGRVHLQYGTGRDVEWFPVGFSPRKTSTTLYFVDGVEPHADLLARLGKHSVGRSCLYVKRLTDIDQSVLAELVTRTLQSSRDHGSRDQGSRTQGSQAQG
jgi:hypothetical protein